MPSWKRIVVSGSDASLNTLTVSNGITGSLFGTASYAIAASSAVDTQDILIYVKNSSGTQINKGKVVQIAGAVGDNPLIATASYTSDNNSANTLGITNESIAHDSFGYVMTEGRLIGIDTSTFTAGQLIYLGATGSIIGTAPLAPLHAVRLGQVLRSQLNNGSIYIRIDNGFELGELHDVLDNTTTGSYGDLLVKSGSIWINSKQLTGSYAITGSLTATSFTGSLQGTASYATQALSSSFAPSTPTFPFTGSAIISGSLRITGSIILPGTGGTILSTPDDSYDMRSNYGAAGRAYFRVGSNGIELKTAGGDPTINFVVGGNINAASSIYSSSPYHIFYGGTNKQMSIGTAGIPTAKLHIAGGTATAQSAPIKLTAGTNLTTPEAGTIEFDGNSLFFTTGSTRQITVAATSALTSSRIPYANSNGRLIDSANLTYGATAQTLHIEGSSGNTLFELTRAGEITYKYNINSSNTLNITTTTNDTSYYFLRGNKFGIGVDATARLHIVAGTATANTAPIKFTAGTNLTTPEAGTIEFNGNSLFFTTGSTRSTILTNTNPADITGNLIVTGSLLVSGSVVFNGNAGVNITGNLIVTGSLLVTGSSLVAGFNPIPLAGTISDGVTSVLGSLNNWNSNYYQGDVLYSETAGGTITFGQLCYRTQNETWDLADATAANSAAAYNMLGICVKSSTATNPTSVLINGFVETATYATIVKSGEPLYMATTAGSMTKTAPTTVGNAVRIIGNTFWDSNTNSKIIIRFNPENSWIEL